MIVFDRSANRKIPEQIVQEQLVPYTRTKCSKKLKNYFLSLLDREDFSTKMADLRKKWGIQLPKTEAEGGVRASSWIENHSEVEIEALDRDIDAVSLEFGLQPLTWRAPLITFLLQGQIDVDEIKEVWANNLLQISTIQSLRLPVGTYFGQEWEDQIFPVVLRISPYASEKEILDFIHKMYTPVISKMQKIFQNPAIKIQTIRTRKTINIERNAFIRKRKTEGASVAGIAREVNKQFPVKGSIVGYSDVRKTLHRTRKKGVKR